MSVRFGMSYRALASTFIVVLAFPQQLKPRHLGAFTARPFKALFIPTRRASACDFVLKGHAFQACRSRFTQDLGL